MIVQAWLDGRSGAARGGRQCHSCVSLFCWNVACCFKKLGAASVGFIAWGWWNRAGKPKPESQTSVIQFGAVDRHEHVPGGADLRIFVLRSLTLRY